MQFLGWMHQKLRQNSNEPFKDFIGNSCACLVPQSSLEDQDKFPEPSRNSQPLRQLQKENQKEFDNLKPNKGVDKEDFTEMDGLFHGFLAIGTLSLDPIISEPPTPTFTMSLEELTENETKVTKNDLKLINDELEKFFEAEAERESCNESSGRNSYVSTVTLSGKHMEGADTEECNKMVLCPLQGYLFGSKVELPETRTEANEEKVSLGELFRRTKIDQSSTNECKTEDVKTEGKYRTAKHLMKKMLKPLNTSKSILTSSGCEVADSVSTKKKLQKVLRMFHRKVHPETSARGKDSDKIHKCEIKNISHGHINENGNLMPLDEDCRGSSKGHIPKGGLKYQNAQPTLPLKRSDSNDSSGNGEHWIKTDADLGNIVFDSNIFGIGAIKAEAMRSDLSVFKCELSVWCSSSQLQRVKQMSEDHIGRASSFRIPSISILHDMSTEDANSLRPEAP
ncbi:hypothetical protein RJ641_007144 [Dillenia turbinata]|uniref:LAZY1 n=1 Tax=Dillenia turbinata TaxID=194707 RepID=A0AAN8V523_9MAGN